MAPDSLSGRFVRPSKFRHVYGQAAKKELRYDNIRLTKNAWDSNLIKVNPKYLSVNWDASGGGAFAVIPLSEVGKLGEQIPLFRGHTAPVLDTDWNPFDDNVVASGSDDATIAIYRVPDNFTLKVEDPEEIEDIKPFKKLTGHSRKVGHVQFHPVAEGILASSSGDYSIKIWNIETGEALYTLQHKDLITSFAFNYDGSLIATTSRDKKIGVWDIRQEKIISEGPGHTGAKASRVVWLGNSDRIATTGFSRLSDRQVAVWNINKIEDGPIGGFKFLDATAGICVPFYDEDTGCLYLAGKGDGNIRYYEFESDELYPLSEFSGDPQRGIAFIPKRAVSVKEHEVVRIYKTVNDTTIEPVSFYVPRKADTFQSDIYPDTRSGVPSLTAEEWASGKNSPPKVISLEAVFEGTVPEPHVAKDLATPKVESPAPKVAKTTKSISEEDSKKSDPQPEQVATPPKQDLEEVFASNEVSSFIERTNKEIDEEPEEESTWDEPVKSESKPKDEPKVESKAESKVEPKEEPKVESKAESKVEPKEEPKVESKEEPKVEPKLEPKEALKDEPKGDSITDSKANGTIPLPSEKDDLLKHIRHLTETINHLREEFKQRDEKIIALEKKLEELL